MEIQSKSYQIEMNETAEFFSSLVAIQENICLVFIITTTTTTTTKNKNIIGYFFVHPYSIHLAPPRLHQSIQKESQPYRDWFIHDMALDPHYRGKGYGSNIYHHFLSEISPTASISLVSVNNTQSFWRSHGFMIKKLEDSSDLRSFYGEPTYMVLSRVLSRVLSSA
jgi:GNAT superfamily N-acetyltransferase